MMEIDLDKIHTTPMGVERIRKNLNLQNENVVEWCKDQIRTAENIERKGKNFYVKTKCNALITINANSSTIITAHRGRGSR